MVKKNKPRKGSLAYSPRKKSKSEIPRVRSYPDKDSPELSGFVGFKAGLTDLVIVDDRPNSSTEGEEINVAATVIETPEIKIAGARGYRDTPYGLKPAIDVDSETLDELKRGIEEDGIDEIRLQVTTSPDKVSGVPRKKSRIMEIPVGGSIEDQIGYVEDKIRSQIRVSELYDSGDYVDVSAVTKGKGTQGPVKRWGVKIQGRKAQRKGKGRHIGNLGPWHPTHVRWQVPQAGQTGFHQRTELNKRILMVGDDPDDINPDGGFSKYGFVGNDYILLKGSVPGPSKRLVRIRDAIRPKGVDGEVDVRYINTKSKQGV